MKKNSKIKKFYKSVIGIFILIFVLFCIAIIFLPSIASSKWGKDILVNAFSPKIDGEMSIHKLHLRWLGPQRVQGLHFKNEDMTFSIDEMQADLKLWDFMRLLHLRLNSFLSLNGNFDLKNGNFDLHIPNYPPAFIEHLNAKMNTHQKTFLIDIDASVRSQDNAHVGLLDISGEIENLLNSQGKIDFKNISCDLKARMQNFPAYIWDFFLKTKNPIFYSLLEDHADIESHIKFQKGKGDIQTKISSENLKTLIDAHLNQSTLTLNKPVRATFYLNQEISSYLLKDTSPLFVTGFKAENPIVLTINEKEFKMPLNPISLKTLSVGQGTLDMGKIEVQNSGFLKTVLGLLKIKKISKNNEIKLWFTPVTFSIQKGILHLNRMDMLVETSLHLCSWGNINLLNKKLDMVLGFTKDTLKQAFGMKHLPQDFVLQVPIEGTTTHPQINSPATATLITALVGAHIEGRAVKKTFFKNQKAPPPHKPFPWETHKW